MTNSRLLPDRLKSLAKVKIGIEQELNLSWKRSKREEKETRKRGEREEKRRKKGGDIAE